MSDHNLLFQPEMMRALLEGRKLVTRRILKPAPVKQLMCLGCGCTEKEYKRDGCTCDKGNLQWLHVKPTRFRKGDRIWTRERWADVNHYGAPAIAYYANGHIENLMDWPDFLNPDGSFDYTDERVELFNFTQWGDDLIQGAWERGSGYYWRPSIFQPKWASRLTLTVSEVRLERVQDIPAHELALEGLQFPTMKGWKQLWDSINRKPKFNKARGIYTSFPFEGHDFAIGALKDRPHHIYGNPWVAAISFTAKLQNILVADR